MAGFGLKQLVLSGLVPSRNISLLAVTNGLLPQQYSSRCTFCSSHSVAVQGMEEEVVIAIGGNVGDRVRNFREALKLMQTAGIEITSHACLYESIPMHFTEQPLFLNTAVSAKTKLDPHTLLHALKKIEADMGRVAGGIRYGPRPIDLDIIFYGNYEVNSETLQIPHPRFKERPFVLAPLVDLLSDELEKVNHWSRHSCTNGGILEVWNQMGGETMVGKEALRRVMPIGKRLWDWSGRTHIMGILNVTPDSFSDGGKYMSVPNAVSHFRSMVLDGADFIDIGAQSTRPHATRLSTEDELSRLAPILEALATLPERENVIISVDTFDAKVAKAAVDLGADMINDISSGTLDNGLMDTVAKLQVPYLIMHMRGDPDTMQNDVNTKYADVVQEVAHELCARIETAELKGIPSWQIITDPGIGFAKKYDHNLELIRGLKTFRKKLSHRSVAISHGPILLGPSRKKFLEKICNRKRPEERDAATIAAAVAGISSGANIIRCHNVRDVRDAALVADAIWGIL